MVRPPPLTSRPDGPQVIAGLVPADGVQAAMIRSRSVVAQSPHRILCGLSGCLSMAAPDCGHTLPARVAGEDGKPLLESGDGVGDVIHAETWISANCRARVVR